MCATVIMRGLTALLSPRCISILLDKVSKYDVHTGSAFKVLAPEIIILLCISFAMILCFRLSLYFYHLKAEPRIKEHIYIDSITRLLGKSTQFQQEYNPGFLNSKITDLHEGIDQLFLSMYGRILPNLLILIFATISLYLLSPLFAVFLLVNISILLTGIFLSRRGLLVGYSKAYLVGSNLAGRIINVLQQLTCIHLFSGKKHEIKGLNKSFVDVIKTHESIMFIFLRMFLCLDVAHFGLTISQFTYLTYGLTKGFFTLKEFTIILFQTNIIFNNLWEVVLAIPDMFGQYQKIGNALEVLHQPVLDVDSKDATKLIVNSGEIVFDQVDFAYPTQDQNFYNQLSVRIAPGQKIGLVGHSGSGKSTFINLILRRFRVKNGSIKIDGQNIDSVTHKSIYQNVALIPQDPMLFDRSIFENIQYGDFHASKEQVIEAAKKADAHDFIMSLKDGYDSNASSLSGGQKQRIAIARAILKDAPIMILDEATSQLDYKTENSIQYNLAELTANKTTIIIAHRLSTVKDVDIIYVFDNGAIVESGSHAQLLEKKGAYHDLCSAQVNGYLPD